MKIPDEIYVRIVKDKGEEDYLIAYNDIQLFDSEGEVLVYKLVEKMRLKIESKLVKK